MLLTAEVRERAAAQASARASPTRCASCSTRIAEGHAVDGMEALAPALVDRLELLVDVLPADTTVARQRPREGARPRPRTARHVAGVPRRVVVGGSRGRQGADRPRGVRLPAARRRAGGRPGPRPGVVDAVGLRRGSRVAPHRRRGERAVPRRPRGGRRGHRRGRGVRLHHRPGGGRRGSRPAPGRGAGRARPRGAGVHRRRRPAARLPAGRREPARVHLRRPRRRQGRRRQGRAARCRRGARKPSTRCNSRPATTSSTTRTAWGGTSRWSQRTVAGATREYLVIEYAPSKRGHPGDRLFVPMDALDQITRYVGGEAPSLDRMGGADWNKRKARARKAVREIAAELIKLYAARQASQGHAFGPDSPWQRELEDNFTYVETPDQMAAITEVKRDMEQLVPMDRLICGDVGYGKTEIAVRAAFKAVMDGKQVAILVPTTLLVQQHYATFADAVRGLPGDGGGAVAVPDGRGVEEDHRGHRRRLGRRRRRHAPPVLQRGAVQGPRPGHHRRGAALRRRPQGGAEEAAAQRRRAGDVGDADPAHAGDGDHGHPRDVGHRHPAGGAPPGAHVRRAQRRQPGAGGDPARAGARGPGVLHPQPGGHDREGGRAHPRPGARGARRRRARPDERAPSRR